MFWRNIDPLTANAQFCDSGSQYRSAIFYHDQIQKTLAEASKKRLQDRFKQPIVTEIVGASDFIRPKIITRTIIRRTPFATKSIGMVAAATAASKNFGELKRNDS